MRILLQVIILTCAMPLIVSCSIDIDNELAEIELSSLLETPGSTTANPMLVALRDFQGDGLEPGKLEITCSDLHPFHGGIEIVVD